MAIYREADDLAGEHVTLLRAHADAQARCSVLLQEQAAAIWTGPGMGISLLISVDALRPSAQFLARNGRIRLGSLLPWSSTGLEEANAEYHAARTATPSDGRRALWVIQAATGKHLTELTADDVIAYTRVVNDKKVRATAGVAWELLKILGLQYKKKYDTDDDMKTLRYGKVMIMADQVGYLLYFT